MKQSDFLSGDAAVVDPFDVLDGAGMSAAVATAVVAAAAAVAAVVVAFFLRPHVAAGYLDCWCCCMGG